MANRFRNKFLTGLRMTKPIIQAPMTGYVTEQMVIEVSNAGGLGSLPATLLSPYAMAAIAPLVGASLKVGSSEIVPFWAGQAVGLGQSMGAAELVEHLSAAALAEPCYEHVNQANT